MPEHNGRQRLLDDLTGDARGGDFEKRLLDRCRGELAFRRFRRRVPPVLAALAVAAAAAMLWPRGQAPAPGRPGIDIVRTVSDPAAIVRSRPAGEILNTRPDGVPDNVIVRTQRDLAVATADDGELLAAFAGVPRGIVRTGPGHSRLVFFDPADEARYYGVN